MGSAESREGRRASFGMDEEERVRVLQGIRLSENVVNRMKDPGQPSRVGPLDPPAAALGSSGGREKDLKPPRPECGSGQGPLRVQVDPLERYAEEPLAPGLRLPHQVPSPHPEARGSGPSCCLTSVGRQACRFGGTGPRVTTGDSGLGRAGLRGLVGVHSRVWRSSLVAWLQVWAPPQCRPQAGERPGWGRAGRQRRRPWVHRVSRPQGPWG